MASEPNYYRAARILVGEEWKKDWVIGVDENGVIIFLDKAERCQHPVTDLGNCSLLPGMIDSHIHGAVGVDVMDARHESLNAMSEFLAANGVTGFVATTVTAPKVKIEEALAQIGQSKKRGVSGAELLGGYLEGPYFTARHKGAHPEHLLQELDVEELKHWISASGNSLISVALAPEKSGSEQAIRFLKQQGIRVMLGHSDASCEQVLEAFSNGAHGVVHCFNGMSGLHHREPGMVGAALSHPDCYNEIIADGHHVHPVAAGIAYRCCGERLLPISDAMQATGMPEGHYQLGELEVEMHQGVVRTQDGGLAGSTLTLLHAVQNLSQWCGIAFEKAWLLASSTPARSLGIDDQLGTLEIGKAASMVAINKQYKVVTTWVRGKCVYSSDTSICQEALCI